MQNRNVRNKRLHGRATHFRYTRTFFKVNGTSSIRPHNLFHFIISFQMSGVGEAKGEILSINKIGRSIWLLSNPLFNILPGNSAVNFVPGVLRPRYPCTAEQGNVVFPFRWTRIHGLWGRDCREIISKLKRIFRGLQKLTKHSR